MRASSAWGYVCVYTRYDIVSARSLPAPGVRALARDRCYKLATMHNSVMRRLSPVGSRLGKPLTPIFMRAVFEGPGS